MVSESERQAIVDEEHLRLLPVFYWVLGALDGFFSLYGLFYVGYGVFMMLLPTVATSSKSPPPTALFALMGWFMIAIGVGFILLFGASAVLKILNGFWISGRRRRTMSLVVAGLTCVSFPFGTIIGIFTFLVMLRPSVKAMYEAVAAAEGSALPGPGVPRPVVAPAEQAPPGDAQ